MPDTSAVPPRGRLAALSLLILTLAQGCVSSSTWSAWHATRAQLDDREREVVGHLLEEMRSLLLGPSDHPALKRVFPAAYHQSQHAEHDAEYQRFMREELVASRLTGIDTVLTALSAKPPLAESQVLALAQAWYGVRLGLGAVLAASAVAFTVVKLIGGLYLLYLGIKLLRAGIASTPMAAHICAIDVPTCRSPGRRSLVKENCSLKPLG
jgi:hypothetical protein